MLVAEHFPNSNLTINVLISKVITFLGQFKKLMETKKALQCARLLSENKLD
jgi:hypothetical protein